MPNQEEISNQVELLRVHRQTLAHLLRQQAAQGGSAFASISVLNGIQDCRNQIQRIKQILSEWKVAFENHPDDGADYFASNQPLADMEVNERIALSDDMCPYVGLNAFQEQHEHLFFGRGRIIDALIEKLSTNRLLVIAGPSGSGKSSLLQAGLIPKLKAEALPGSQFWLYPSPIIPGSTSIDQLRKENAHDTLSGKQSNVTPNTTCLVIDQFENVFTVYPDREQRLVFVTKILYLIQETQKHKIIIAMRADMMNFVALFPELQTIFERSVCYIPPMSVSELRESILNPAQQIGLRFESKVVDSLVNDIIGEPSALPLLQFSLLKLWERREYNKITFSALTHVGGGRLALARHADQFYDGLLQEQQIVAKDILLCLVSSGNSLEIVSRSIRLEELHRLKHSPERIDNILMKLTQAKLVRLIPGNTPESNEYAVAHDSLPRNWPRFVNWIDDARAK